MKDITSYLLENDEVQNDFVEIVKKLNPGVPADVKRYFSEMYQHGICMHPDDSWSDCTLPFTSAQAEILDEFTQKALEIHGDSVYDWGTAIYMKLWNEH